MYYPIGWHKVLDISTQVGNEYCDIISIQTNSERNLLFILTGRSIHIWNANPQVEIVSHKRSPESIVKAGSNLSAIIKPDSSVIVVLTDYNQLLFYQVQHRVPSSSKLLLNGPMRNLYHDSVSLYNIVTDHKRINSKVNLQSSHYEIPAISVFIFGKLDLSYIGISCLMSAEEELIVASPNGEIYGVLWHGKFDEKFPWSICNDEKEGVFVEDIRFSSALGGFSAVFSNGEAGFIPLNIDPRIDSDINHNVDNNGYIKSKLKTKYLAGINNATCSEVNHKYRLLAFGLKDSQIIVFSLGDSSIEKYFSSKLPLSKFPNIKKDSSPVTALKYSPDSFALMSCWSNGGFAIWSVFGSLLFYSGQWQVAVGSEIVISSFCWGIEGYELFVCCQDKDRIPTSSDRTYEEDESTSDEQASLSKSCNNSSQVLVLSLARSAILLSPNSSCSNDSVVLVSSDKLLIGPSMPNCDKFDHWLNINIPQEYLSQNYPIKKAVIDRDCKMVAITGNSGYAILDLKSESWFISKKNNFSIAGDLIWYNEYFILSCYNFDSSEFEIRAYNSKHIDDDSFITQITPLEVICMSIFENRILVLYIDGTMAMFMLNLRKIQRKITRANSIATERIPIPGSNVNSNSSNQKPKIHDIQQDFCLHIASIEGLVVSSILVNPYCITSVTLTRLHFKNNRSDDSILLNACGKLFLLEREMVNSTSPSSPILDGDNKQGIELEKKLNEAKHASNHTFLASASIKNSQKPGDSLVAFGNVTMIASNVEHYWICPDIASASDLSYFKRSLWLHCGGLNHELKVWFPLLVDKNNPPTSHQYTPNRIMLEINCDTYPVAIKSSSSKSLDSGDTCDDTIILGAESDVLDDDVTEFSILPFCTVKRRCQVYLHRILLLLLKKNLGYYAEKVADSCQNLPYFRHSFELLLHEVLEEEATSPRAIPDPMLPQVVDFIRQWPVYLETVVHCARKSEPALWPHLFSIVGNPQKLFQECLDKGSLDTAASCLIILQSFDRHTISQDMVKKLVSCALKDPEYKYLIEELETFSIRAELDSLDISNAK